MRKKTSSEPKSKPRKSNVLFQKRQMQIIKKATKLFMKKGYVQTSMREISKATGIDIRNLYYFIKSKEDILFLVFEMIHKREEELFEQEGLMSVDDPLQQLKTLIHEFIYYSYDYADEILLLYRESKALSKRLLKIILARESKVVFYLEEILKKGKAKKVFQFEDASFTANMIIYQLSLRALRRWNMKKYSKEKLIDLLESQILKSVMV